ncbi:hypothetical protein VTL71DRAFT_77 [Oculimacula yallundae]|uniref:Uncharacterized protein n=1 Tax=Oculimacula yallundae TaxID=86028 RepID=A0ABR4CZ70_9HELO
MILIFSILSAAFLTRSPVTATTFSTQCTAPLERVTFVTSPNTRGTLDILYGSLFTIFICIWTVQHLNVPEQRDGRDQHWRGDIKWALKGPQKKVKWMLVTLLAPEVLLAKSLAELMAAKRSVAIVRAIEDRTGNFLSENEVGNWTMSHTYYAEMGGFAFQTSIRRESGEGPSIVKLTAVLQVTWMVVQVLVRAARGLPISQLEITACAFAACTFVTYVLWWNKPQAVTVCTEIIIEDQETWRMEILNGTWRNIEASQLPYKSIFQSFVPQLGEGKTYTRADMPIPNDALPGMGAYSVILSGVIVLGLFLGCILLGAIHCSAWNFYLPTRTEQILWRCFSLASCFLIPVFYVLGSLLLLASAIGGFGFLDSGREFYVLSSVCSIIYVTSRLFLLFESIWSLFHLPPRAFITTWSSNIPHM